MWSDLGKLHTGHQTFQQNSFQQNLSVGKEKQSGNHDSVQIDIDAK